MSELVLENLYRFPKKWLILNFPEIVFFQEGPGLRSFQFTDHGMKVVNVTNIVDGHLNLSNTNKYISKVEFVKKYSHFAVEKEDILMASSGATYGKTAFATANDLPLMMNTSVIRLHPKYLDCIDGTFLKYFLQTEFFKIQIRKFVTGSAQPNFGPTHLNKTKIIVPPLNEQKRIVSKIESIFAQIDAGREKLDNVKKLLKQCRQSILKDVFKGANFKITVLENLILFSKNGFTGKPNKNNQGIPRLGIETITSSNSIFVNEVKHKFIDISSSKQMIYAAEKGDLFFCRQNGNKNNVGKCKVLKGIIKPMIFSDSLIQFRVNNNKIIPEYIVCFVNSLLGRSQIEQYCSTTAGNFSINGTNLKKIQIKYPSLSEQYRIVSKIESIFVRIDSIEKQVDDSLIKLDQLKKSTLKKAFEGNLVPQDPSDEPASVLLEKIKPEKSSKKQT